jgi:AraC-like DNA-binding protein/mannose-6-phosphate isomerase-like protein (cupin superfamily)
MLIREILGAYQVEVETGGYVRFDIQPTNSPHRHNYFEICIVLEGEGRYIHGSSAWPLQKGSLFLAEPGIIHEITSFETRDLHLYFITLQLRRLVEADETAEDRIIAKFLKERRVTSQGHEILAGYAPLLDRSSGREIAAGQLLKWFALEAMKAMSKVAIEETADTGESEIELALAYIDRNLERKLSVVDIARHLGISERTLRRRFRSLANTSVTSEINHRRMRRAAHRLLMGFSVAEVADYSGIPNPSQFTRSFAKAFGMAPKQFQSSYIPGTLARQTRPPG